MLGRGVLAAQNIPLPSPKTYRFLVVWDRSSPFTL